MAKEPMEMQISIAKATMNEDGRMLDSKYFIESVSNGNNFCQCAKM
jgi:hypothetical protein